VVLPWLASAWFFDYGWDEEEGGPWCEAREEERSGFLHCAAHDTTVSNFGRNDIFGGEEDKRPFD
jgi:hypothetical protein